jgi:hypothetical protein
VPDIEERHQGFARLSVEVPLEVALAKVVGSVDARCHESVIGQRVVGADPRIHLIDGKQRKGGSVGVASKEATFGFMIVDGESDRGVFTGDRAGTKFGIIPKSSMMGIPRMVLTVMSLPKPKEIWTGFPLVSA